MCVCACTIYSNHVECFDVLPHVVVPTHIRRFISRLQTISCTHKYLCTHWRKLNQWKIEGRKKLLWLLFKLLASCHANRIKRIFCLQLAWERLILFRPKIILSNIRCCCCCSNLSTLVLHCKGNSSLSSHCIMMCVQTLNEAKRMEKIYVSLHPIHLCARKGASRYFILFGGRYLCLHQKLHQHSKIWRWTIFISNIKKRNIPIAIERVYTVCVYSFWCTVADCLVEKWQPHGIQDEGYRSLGPVSVSSWA